MGRTGRRLIDSPDRIVELSMALDQKVEQLTAARGVQQEYVMSFIQIMSDIGLMIAFVRSLLRNNSLHSQLEGKEAEITSLGSSITSVNQTCVSPFTFYLARSINITI